MGNKGNPPAETRLGDWRTLGEIKADGLNKMFVSTIGTRRSPRSFFVLRCWEWAVSGTLRHEP
jgi:hypothetical protein